ncbi:hypothetical protein PANO111632_02755 [Paracoccus nototheniae]|uniref:Uncharacterized protein n=1 Tax=Paracoccus nototheniae TaxID=2489002 RepID=A0ABW4DV55_9RHOB|nr:hypothetical protein [Paracoccus nototheniae]
MSEKAMIQAFMASLIDKVGGFDAAAAVIGARLGHDISKGSISKRQSGQLGWPLLEIMALEDAAGDRCVRRWLRRCDPEAEANDELMSLLAIASKESGEAFTALLKFAAGTGSLAEARKEVEDAISVKRRIAGLLASGDQE